MKRFKYHSNKELTFLKSGLEYKSKILELIDESVKYVVILIYTFKLDKSGHQILNKLAQARRRGVNILILVDYIGSSELTIDDISYIKSLDLKIKFWGQIKTLSNLGRRLHSKVLIVDGVKSIVGGVNFSDDYLDCKPNKEPWLDFGIYINGKSTTNLLTKIKPYWKQYVCLPKYKFINQVQTYTTEQNFCRIVKNDWQQNIKDIGRSYIKLIKQANENIIIISSYFFPPKTLIRALKNAKGRGVEITFIFPERSDIKLLKIAMEYLYSYLLKYKFKIFEFNKSILHGKAICVDSKWLSIGSFNMDHTSYFGNIELNIETSEPKLIKQFMSFYNDYIIIHSDQIFNESFYNKKNYLFKGIFYFIYRSIVYLSLLLIMPYKKIHKLY